MSTERKRPLDRIQEIIECASSFACEKGYKQIDRNMISKKLGVSRGIINTYFGNMDGLRFKVIEHAIETNNSTILAQAIINNEPQVDVLNTIQKRKILLLALR